MPIHADRRGWILSDQKVYGLCGLYSVSARTSGLIPEGALDVTEDTRAFLKRNYIDRLDGAARPLLRLLAKGGTLDTRGKDRVFSTLADMLAPAFNQDEVEFYGRRLRDGCDVPGSAPERQGRFRSLLETQTDLDALVGRAELLSLAKTAAQVDEELAGRLERIAHLEALLAPAEALFQHIIYTPASEGSVNLVTSAVSERSLSAFRNTYTNQQPPNNLNVCFCVADKS